ncbi:unnamed protein product [Clonostachys rosea]|uniref:Uncharacterized protein n=1 Tax=Bionectria ochroleuca TaxID=29856 RepID=A0ABY6TY07_BIOOC|nr:unnamed protein product [Clonostachys rosea]
MPTYPGLGRYLHWCPEHGSRLSDGAISYPIGINSDSFGASSEMLLVREVAMMVVMDLLTDKPDFHVKIFDDEIAKKWKTEALAIPDEQLYQQIANHLGSLPPLPKGILDEDCLDYCIQELRAKAEFYKKTSLVPTMDACASACKSDTIVDDSLKEELRAAFIKLKEEQGENPDWHPRSHDQVQDLVHPSLYPLVYGKSRVFTDEVVGVEDAIDKWAGKGEVIPKPTLERPQSQSEWEWRMVEPAFWSTEYQWLPANLQRQADGKFKFTSYINNLHPNKHAEIYATIEKLVEKALPAWDLCLNPDGRASSNGGRNSLRIPVPEDPSDENEDNWDPPSSEHVDVPKKYDSEGEEESEEEDDYGRTPQEAEWHRIRRPIHPKPPSFQAWNYQVDEGSRLRDRYDRLQVIVKMASIEIATNQVEFPAGNWHVEGQMNEHIVGTALYYLDSENVTPSYLDFRMPTSYEQDDLQDKLGQDQFDYAEQIYGTDFKQTTAMQYYGRIETKEGRLLAFPNVFHHRVSDFERVDETKPGHRRFIALWLVDPETRIISTANVPPQQQSWWLDNIFQDATDENAGDIPQVIAQHMKERIPSNEIVDTAVETGKSLPAELTNMIREELEGDSLLMSLDEAKEHRLKVMDVRSRVHESAEQKWNRNEYFFCEH